MLIFKHSDWLLKIFNQSEFLKLCSLKSKRKIILGPAPGLPKYASVPKISSEYVGPNVANKV